MQPNRFILAHSLRFALVCCLTGCQAETPPSQVAPPGVRLMTQNASQDRDHAASVVAVMQNSTASDMRRMTRTEFRNSVRDLLSLTFEDGDDPTRTLPPDPPINGFDKRAEGLTWEGALLDSYLSVATEIADRAIVTGDLRNPPVPTRRLRFEFEDIPVHPYEVTTKPWVERVPDGLILMSGVAGTKRGLRRDDFHTMVPVAGRYAVRVRAAASRPEPNQERVLLRLWRPAIGQTLLETFVDAPRESPQTYEVVLPMTPEGADEIVAIFVNAIDFGQANLLQMEMNSQVEQFLAAGNPRQAARLRAQARAEGVIATSRPNPKTVSTARLPRLFLDWIEIEGPLYESWPPRSHQTVFSSEQGDASNRQYVERIFTPLLQRAYRRTPDASDLARVVDVVEQEMKAGRSLVDAVKSGLVVMLCSPDFLMIGSRSKPANSSQSDDRLAERLSYFLWSSLPDDELLTAAQLGDLHPADALKFHALRMLEDRRSEALVTDFARQWLKIDDFDRFAPDVELYPEFARPENTRLDQDFQDETLEFFREVMNAERPISSFLDSDWTMLNERLARHYGLPDVSGDAFRRVLLPADSPRGGLLGMAGLHRLGSDGNRTRPVQRSAYLLDVLFNDPPPLPPPNVGEVEPNMVGENHSVRERLAMHRDVEGCAECHRKIDCYGLALENFNAVGRWRENQDGEVRNWAARGGAPPIDSSGVLPDGRRFGTFREFKQLLASDETRLMRSLAEKLLAYSLGRELEPDDAQSVASAMDYADQHHRTLPALIVGVVLSDAFRSR